MPSATRVVNRRGPRAALLLLLIGMTALALTAPTTSGASSDASALVADANSSAWRTEWGGFYRVRDMAMVAADDVWVVGSNLAHFDGAVWRAVDRRDTDAYYSAIDLFGSRDGWAVGQGFTQRLRDGLWEGPVSLPDANFYDVALTDVDEGWAVGYDRAAKRPAMWRLVGGTWSELPAPAIPAVALWMASAVEGWAVGAGQLAHYDGRVWTPVVVPGVKGLRAVAGSGPDDVWAGGGSDPAPGPIGPGQSQLLHYDGRSWSLLRDAAGPGIAAIAVAEGRGYALGYEGELLALKDGSWREVAAKVPAGRVHLDTARLIALSPGQTSALVGTDRGKIFRLQDEQLLAAHRSAEIHAVGFTRPYEGWALGPATANLKGSGRTPVALRWDGRGWSPLSADHPLAGAVDIGVLGPQDAWAVGPAGAILRFDGQSWTRVASPTGVDLLRVRVVTPDLVLALGYGQVGAGDLYRGVVLRFDGVSWQEIGAWEGPYATVGRLYDVDARAPDQVWVAASNSLRRFDGQTWTSTEVRDGPISLAMSGPRSGWLGTVMGSILQVDGEQMTEALQFTGASTVYRLTLDSASGGWALGGNGYVAHLDGDQWTVRRGPATLCNCAVPTALMGLALLDIDGLRQIWVVGSEETILHSTVAEVLAQPAITPENETAVPFTVIPNDTATPARTPTATRTALPRSGQRLWLPLLVLAALPEPPTPLAGPTGGAATASSTAASTTTATPSTTPSPLPTAPPSATPQARPSATAMPPETPARPTSETTPVAPIAPDFAPFGLVQLEPELRLNGSGSIIDSLAF